MTRRTEAGKKPLKGPEFRGNYKIKNIQKNLVNKREIIVCEKRK